MNELQNYYSQFIESMVSYIPRLLSAFIILIVGILIIKSSRKITHRIMVKETVDPTLLKFLLNVFVWMMRVLLFIAVISKLGVETSSFVAILGAASLAIGLSLQGSLANFAGGILIILFRPFKMGDTIEAQGILGTVKEIQIFVTKIITANNQVVSVPNGALSNGVIVNYSIEKIRRADFTISISYDANLKLAKDIITDIVLKNPLILKDPVPSVVIKELTSTVILIAVRPWSDNDTFGTMSSSVLEEIRIRFQEAGIKIPMNEPR